MKLEMYNKNGLVIKTKNKFCLEDIEVYPAFPTSSDSTVHLFPPSVAIQDTDYIVVTDIVNGEFATSWRLYDNGTLVEVDLTKDQKVDLTQIFTVNGEHMLQAKAFSDLLAPSNLSNAVYYLRIIFTEGLSYQKASEGNYAICTGIGTATLSYIAIASEYTLFGVTYPVTEIGEEAFDSNTQITSLVVPDSVSRIDSKAFNNCQNLTSVILPESLISVGTNAFLNCTNILKLNFKGSVDKWAQISFSSGSGDAASNPLYYTNSLFINGIEVKEVLLSNAVTKIGAGAFAGYKGATISIPESVTEIGRYAFSECTSNILWPGTPTIQIIGDSAFSGYKGSTVIIPESVTEIGYSAFSDSSIQEITIPAQLDYIRANAFKDCKSLKTVNFPKLNNISISSYAFLGCSSLEVISFTNILGNITIADSLFEACTNLKQVFFNKVSRILQKAFYGCKKLELLDFRKATTIPTLGTDALYNVSANLKIIVPNNLYNSWIVNQYWSAYANYIYKASDFGATEGLTYELSADGTTASCTGLGTATETDIIIADTYQGVPVTAIADNAFNNTSITTLIIQAGITSIGNYAFNSCASLKTVTFLDNNLITISDYAFSNCQNLVNFRIPSSVTTIGDYAFYNCYNLPAINIPNSVTTIGYRAFMDCFKAESITLGAGVTNIGNYAFDNVARDITIPTGFNVYYLGTLDDWFNIAFSFISNDDYIHKYSANPLINHGALYIRAAKVTTLNIPTPYTEVPEGLFAGCTSITSVILNDGITTLKEASFYDCQNLESVVFGRAFNAIDLNALERCTKLKLLDFRRVTAVATRAPADINEKYNEALQIVVPDSLYDEWITSNVWAPLADHIVKVSEYA